MEGPSLSTSACVASGRGDHRSDIIGEACDGQPLAWRVALAVTTQGNSDTAMSPIEHRDLVAPCSHTTAGPPAPVSSCASDTPPTLILAVVSPLVPNRWIAATVWQFRARCQCRSDCVGVGPLAGPMAPVAN